VERYDWVIVGSGFGGSVSALRLMEKGYRVLLLEKGRRFAVTDFPETNWDVPRWMWRPEVGLKGIFQMSFLPHVTILHGVGFGGGSLTYANTLPVPKRPFFESSSWRHLANWYDELAPHYATAKRMLGAATNPTVTPGDKVLRAIAKDLGKEERFHATDVAVFFGPAGKEVPDPYFDGKGPARTGCTFCGACMTGCRVGAKNTLDRNYLYLAEKLGLEVRVETEVTKVSPEEGGYQIETRGTFSAETKTFHAERVIFSGGVMGTVPLLLKLKEDPTALPKLSERVGGAIRTNSEALIGVVAPDSPDDYSTGVAITSILETDDQSHIEPVRYAKGSDFFRLMILPHAPGENVLLRLAGAVRGFFRHPRAWMKAFSGMDFSSKAQILLYMRTLEGTLRLRLGRHAYTGFSRGVVSELEGSTEAPKAFMDEATDLANRFAEKIGGVPVSMFTETLMGTPSTAHILGGACMGNNANEGVIDAQHRVFGYDGLYVIDGSAVSSNPGVNPSLTITALAERAMTFIPQKTPS
jgi:cholesterol oxidase